MSAAKFTEIASSDTWPVDTIYAESVCVLEDIYYHGSEDDNYPDSDTRRARYETAGHRFLGGKAPILLTASLRGPFDKASGWKNPWASQRTPSEHEASTGIKTNVSLKPTARNNGLKSPVCNIEGYLPSPESLKQSPAVQHPYLASEKVDVVHEWRELIDVQTEIEDSFWEPGDSAGKTPTKRRLEQDLEWLSSTPSKRPRTSANRTARMSCSPVRKSSTMAEGDVRRQGETRGEAGHSHSPIAQVQSSVLVNDVCKTSLGLGIPSPSKSSESSFRTPEAADTHHNPDCGEDVSCGVQTLTSSQNAYGGSSFRSFLTRLVSTSPWGTITQLASSISADKAPTAPTGDGSLPKHNAKEMDAATYPAAITAEAEQEQGFMIETQPPLAKISTSEIHDDHDDTDDHSRAPLTSHGGPREPLGTISPNARVNTENISPTNEGDFQVPLLPKASSARQHTPEPQFNIKPFASFLSPSPLKPTYAALNSRPGHKQGLYRSVLKNYTGPRLAGLQVTWAASVQVEGDEAEELHTSPNKCRQSSPPPEPSAESQGTDDGKFQKHFEAVASRTSAPPPRAITTDDDGDVIVSNSKHERAGPEEATMPVPRMHDFDTEEPLDIMEDMVREMGFWDTWNVDAELNQARRAQGAGAAEPV